LQSKEVPVEKEYQLPSTKLNTLREQAKATPTEKLIEYHERFVNSDKIATPKVQEVYNIVRDELESRGEKLDIKPVETILQPAKPEPVKVAETKQIETKPIEVPEVKKPEPRSICSGAETA
jgi:hypothetical protein